MVVPRQSGWQRVKGAISFKPVATRHEVGLLRDTGVLALAFVAGIEAIYLTDLIINRILPRVLENGASLTNVLALAVLAIPSSLYISMPVAVLTSVYFVVLRRRESREHMVFAGMGKGVGRLLVFGAGVGTIALLMSLFISGFLDPLSRYQAGRTMFEVRLEAIRSGALGAGNFYQHDGFTIFAGSGRTSTVANNIFFLQEQGEGSYRLVTASQSNRLDAPTMTSAGVILRNAAVFDFGILRQPKHSAECPDCAPLTVVPIGARASSQILIELPNLRFDEREPRGNRIDERTSIELLDGDLTNAAVAAELGDRLFQALLVFIAPLLAILAVSQTRPTMILIALPAAAGAVLAGSFFGSQLVDMMLPLGLGGMSASLIAGTFALGAIVVALVLRFENGCIQHGGVQI